MFERYKAWNRRSEQRTEMAEEHNWGTIVHLIVNKGGQKWFAGYVFFGIWIFACVAFFFGAAIGSMMYVDNYTVPMWLSAWWPWMAGAVIVGVFIEFKTRSTRDFYRQRKAMFGSWFR